MEAERLGLDGILLTEHHFDGWTMVPSPNLFLMALAMRTTRLRLGQAVHVLPIHNPWRLAEEAGMLDGQVRDLLVELARRVPPLGHQFGDQRICLAHCPVGHVDEADLDLLPGGDVPLAG